MVATEKYISRRAQTEKKSKGEKNWTFNINCNNLDIICFDLRINSQQLITTCILAIVGAAISFFTTLLLRSLLNFLNKQNWDFVRKLFIKKKS